MKDAEVRSVTRVGPKTLAQAVAGVGADNSDRHGHSLPGSTQPSNSSSSSTDSPALRDVLGIVS